MNKGKLREPDLDDLLKRTLKDDPSPEAEARMTRQFLNLKRTLDRPESPVGADAWSWVHGLFRKEIVAVAAAAMIIAGLVMQLSSPQTALAHSIEQLKVIATLSAGLSRASSMDCTVLKAGPAGEQTSYRIRWRASGDVRVDMEGSGGAQTLWISDATVSVGGTGSGNGSRGVRSMSIDTMTPGPVWQPALEFASPNTLANRLQEKYGLMQSSGRVDAGTDEFLITGREGRNAVEVTVDSRSYLPKVLKKYSPDSVRRNGNRACLLEARFHWNQPISPELFIPGPLEHKQ